MRMSRHLLLILLLSAPAYAQDAAPAEAEVIETVPVNDASAEEAAAETAEPLALYGGFDLVRGTYSANGEFDSDMYRGRIGRRWLEQVGVEAMIGRSSSERETDTARVDQYYGVFLVPMATVWDKVELGFPVGYAFSLVQRPGQAFGESLDSLAYGLDARLPLRLFRETLPDLRLTAGWMVYSQNSAGRLYGANLGLRYDFSLGGS